MERTRKIDTLLALMAAGSWERAIRFAARFPRLGEHKVRIERAQAAYEHPDFMRQVGHDVEALKRDGVAALCERYHVTPPAPAPAP